MGFVGVFWARGDQARRGEAAALFTTFGRGWGQVYRPKSSPPDDTNRSTVGSLVVFWARFTLATCEAIDNAPIPPPVKWGGTRAFEKAVWSAVQRWPSFQITDDPVDREATGSLESPDRFLC